MAGELGAAAGGADMLQEILRQRFTEAIQRQRLKEEIRQADMRNAVEQRQLGQGDQRLGLDQQRLGEDTRQFDISAGQRDRGLNLEEQMQPVRIKHIGAQTADIERKPQAEQQERDFGEKRDKTRHGYEMQQIGASGQNALRVANVRHPDAGSAAVQAAAQKEQNEVQDSLDLIKQIREDKARSKATGPIQGRGVGMLQGLGDYTRVKALHDNLVNRLQLAQAGKLKGQGQISNMEREMLAKAATALTRSLDDQDYLNELGKVEAQFTRMLSGPRAVNAPAASGGARETPEQRIKRLLGGG